MIKEEVRDAYDRYVAENNKRVLQNAGITTVVQGVSLVSLITGLSLALKRNGYDLKADAKKKSGLRLSLVIRRKVRNEHR